MTTRSYGERKAAQHVEQNPNPLPQDQLLAGEPARQIRNLDEWRKARADAVRMNDLKAVQILDEEYRRGLGQDFPASDDDLGPSADDDLGPPVAAVAQPAAQPAPSPMTNQRADEAQFEIARRDWRKATKGVLKPGQTENQAVAEWSGIIDPSEITAKNSALGDFFDGKWLTARSRRDRAEVEETRQTGAFNYGDSVAFAAAKTLGAMAGFAAAGPIGATAADALSRALAIEYGLQQRLRAGAITAEEADEIFYRELADGVKWDAILNFGVPLAGQVISKIPGMSRVFERVGRVAAKVGSKATEGLPRMAPGYVVDDIAGTVAKTKPAPTLREQRIEKLAEMAETPERATAIRELGKRTKEAVPTRGQVEDDLTGVQGWFEGGVRRAQQGAFNRQGKELTEGAEKMRQEALGMAGEQPARAELGQRLTDLAKNVQRAVKARLAPTFEAAKKLDVKVDMNTVAQRAEAELAADAARPTAKLHPHEAAHLRDLVARIRGKNEFIGPGMRSSEAGKFQAGDALDFMTTEKDFLRQTTADWKPGKHFNGIIGDMIKDADSAFTTAAARAGQSKVRNDLIAARDTYREMMQTIYDDAVETALKKMPEDVGRLFWQGGATSEPKQLQRMFDIARREGVMSVGERAKVSQDMVRGFLQEAVKTPEAAAQWSQTLRQDPLKRETWNALTSAPGGKQLRKIMDVVEQAAQVATKDTVALGGGTIMPMQRASAGAIVQTKPLDPTWGFTALNLAGIGHMAATFYTHGNIGALNTLLKVARTHSMAPAAAAAVLKQEMPKLKKWVREYGIEEEIEVPAEEATDGR